VGREESEGFCRRMGLSGLPVRVRDFRKDPEVRLVLFVGARGGGSMGAGRGEEDWVMRELRKGNAERGFSVGGGWW